MSNRILFVSYTADLTGPTNSLLLLLTHLRDSYDVSVLLPGQGLFSEALADEQIPSFSFPSLTKWSIPAIVRLIKRERFRLVYGNDSSGSSRNALIAAKLAGVPFICHVRDLGAGRSRLKSAHLNLADAVVAVSYACADSLRGRVLASKLNVVHNGIDLDGQYPGKAAGQGQLRQQLGVSGQRPVLIFVGHLKPVKGQEYAVQAVAKSIHNGTDLDLLLVGSHDRDRAYVRRIRELIDDLGVSNRVRLVGFSTEIRTLLSIADVYIHTSLAEAHPRAVLEAMAAGLPVIAFAVGGVVETVEHGRTGFLVPKGDISGLLDAVLKLATDPTLRTQFGVNGRRRVEAYFSAKETARKIESVIEAVL